MKKKQNENAFAPKKTFKERLHDATSAKAFRLGGYSAISIVVVIVIAVVLNLAVGKLPSTITKLDTTADKLTEISEQTEKLVAGLKDNVTFYWIVQDGGEDATIEQLLNRYKDLSSHVKVEKKDPVVNPNFASQYTSEKVYNNSLIITNGKKNQYVSYEDIYVTDYTNYYTTGETSTEFYGESAITSAIDYVTSDSLPKMYVLVGHGSASVDASLANMITKQNIEVTSLNLLSSAAVPEDCDVLMIYAPETDLSVDEAAAITKYLKAGGKLMLVTGYTKENMPNFDKVMAAYGTALKDGVVFEGSEKNYYRQQFLLFPNIGTHEITTPISEGYYVLYPEAQAITTLDSKPDSVTISPLLTTSDSAYIKLNVENLETLEKEKGDEKGTYTVGAAITDSKTNAQIVWFTSTLFTQSSYDQAVGGINTDLFLNSLSWMCKSESSITIHAKPITNEYLTVSSLSSAMLSLVVVVLLPLAFIAVGVYVAISRKKR